MLNNGGYSLVSLLINLGIGSVALSVTATAFIYAMEQEVDFVVRKAFRDIRSEVSTYLSRESVVTATLKSPLNQSSLSCHMNKSECINEWKPLNLVIPVLDDGGDVVGVRSLDFFKKALPQSDSSIGKEGFNSTGSSCNEFGTEEGSIICPFQVVLEWKPLCSAATCTGAGLELRAQIVRSTDLKRFKKFNLQKLNYSMFIPREATKCEVKDYIEDSNISTDRDGTACDPFFEKIDPLSLPSTNPWEGVTNYNPNGSIFIINVYEGDPMTHINTGNLATSTHKLYDRNINIKVSDGLSPNSVTIILSSYEPLIWNIQGNVNAVKVVYLASAYCTDIVAPGLSADKVQNHSGMLGFSTTQSVYKYPGIDDWRIEEFLDFQGCKNEINQVHRVYSTLSVGNEFKIPEL